MSDGVRRQGIDPWIDTGSDLHLRPVWAEIDLDAITANARALARLAAPAHLCAVVKAFGYGHGPVDVAKAAQAGGAACLGVALVEEGRNLRAAGIGGPIIVLSEPPAPAMTEVVSYGLSPVLYTDVGVAAAGAAALGSARPGRLDVHVKVDTGMHRVGASPAEAVALALAVSAHPRLRLAGLMTHFAVADEVDEDGITYTKGQLATFLAVVDEVAAAGVRIPLLHAANSAATLLHPESRLDLVRCGIALYGVAPASGLALGPSCPLRPALSLRARVSFVKHVAEGERLSYGLNYRVGRPGGTTIATVPIGYADGVPRRLASVGGEVLIGGRRLPIAGTVTMDQLLVDCGPCTDLTPPVAVGDEVVLIGEQDGGRIDAWEWADRLDTIAYEILCGIGARVPRRWTGGAQTGGVGIGGTQIGHK